MGKRIDGEETMKAIGYTEDKLEYCDGSVVVAIRKYPKNYWIAYQDLRFDQLTGNNVEDCFLPDFYLFEKIPHGNFNKEKVLNKLKEHLQSKDYLQEDYGKVGWSEE